MVICESLIPLVCAVPAARSPAPPPRHSEDRVSLRRRLLAPQYTLHFTSQRYPPALKYGGVCGSTSHELGDVSSPEGYDFVTLLEAALAKRKPDLPDDGALKIEALKKLVFVMRNADKLQYVDVTCKHCGKRQRVQALVPDNSNSVKAAGEIIDRIEGKAATKREAPKPKVVGGNLDELSDEELVALLQEEPSGETDGSAAEEAA